MPSLILFVVVGGMLAIAAIAVFARRRHARGAASLAGMVVVIWIVTQVVIIGYVSWMQPVTLFAGCMVMTLAWPPEGRFFRGSWLALFGAKDL